MSAFKIMSFFEYWVFFQAVFGTENSNNVLVSFLDVFGTLKLSQKNRPVLIILPYYNLCKNAIIMK